MITNIRFAQTLAYSPHRFCVLILSMRTKLSPLIALLAGLAVAAVSMAAGTVDPWTPAAIPARAAFRGLSAPSASIIWASGTRGTVVRSTDGGATWQVRAVSGAEKLDFRGIRAFDADTAVVISSGNAETGGTCIYRTTDGGATWQLAYQSKVPGTFFDAVAFWDRRHGIVLSDSIAGHLPLFATDDGGATWRQIPPEGVPAALPGEGAFAASNSSFATYGSKDIWLATTKGRIFRSKDRGRHWTVTDTPVRPPNDSSGLFSIAFRDAKHGIAVGGDYNKPGESPVPNVIVTDDGGKTWRTGQPTDPSGLFLSAVVYQPAPKGARANGPPTILAAGPLGAVISVAGGPWTRESSKNFNVLAFPAPGAAWAAGPRGFVARRTMP